MALRVIKGNAASSHMVTFKGALEVDKEKEYSDNVVEYLNRHLVLAHGTCLDELVCRIAYRISSLL